MLRFRTLNLVACVILLVFNAMIGVWPMVGMNAVLAAINVWFIVKLLRERHDEAAFAVVEVGGRRVPPPRPAVHGTDILRFQPDFVWDPSGEHGHAFVVLKGDETVGVVLVEADGPVARVQLDYVTPRYRDFSPGEFVWRRSGLLREHGFARVVTPPGMVAPYYDRLGFHARAGGTRSTSSPARPADAATQRSSVACRAGVDRLAGPSIPGERGVHRRLGGVVHRQGGARVEQHGVAHRALLALEEAAHDVRVVRRVPAAQGVGAAQRHAEARGSTVASLTAPSCTTQTFEVVAVVSSSSPSSPRNTQASTPRWANTPGHHRRHPGSAQPIAWAPGRAGFASGPRKLNVVPIPSSRRARPCDAWRG